MQLFRTKPGELQTIQGISRFFYAFKFWEVIATSIFMSLLWLYPARDQVFTRGPHLIVGVVLGWVIWTAAEYAIHRFFYHWTTKIPFWKMIVDSSHLYHHRKLGDYRVLNAGPLMSVPLSALQYGIVYAVTQDVFWAGSILFGLTLGYTWYEWVHRIAHVNPSWGPKWLRKHYLEPLMVYHDFHHKRAWATNYGVTTMFWDKIMKTYQAIH